MASKQKERIIIRNQGEPNSFPAMISEAVDPKVAEVAVNYLQETLDIELEIWNVPEVAAGFCHRCGRVRFIHDGQWVHVDFNQFVPGNKGTCQVKGGSR